jgi:hypothetical protein
LVYLDLIEWDLVRPEHQHRFINSPTITEAPPMIARGLDKCGRMVIVFKNDGVGVVVAVQNGQYLTTVYTSKDAAEVFKNPAKIVG